MGIRRFLSFLRQKSSASLPILQTMANEMFVNVSVAVDANNYFYKLLNTEEDLSNEIEQIFCALTCSVHDTIALSVIQEHLMRCETASERHLLRCLYIFSMFCYRSLQIRHLIFVLDGAAPSVKTSELIERKQQKRNAHGKLLNERRALLLHRIYLLRWYQILCIAWGYGEQNQTLSSDSATVCHMAMFRLLQQSFEWAIGTEIPERLFVNAAQGTFLGQMNRVSTSLLLQLFSRLRMNVQTSFLVEFDFTDASDDFLQVVIPLLVQFGDTVETSTRKSVRPFLVCIHICAAQTLFIQEYFKINTLEQRWLQCTDAYLTCIVLHAVSTDGTESADFVVPKSFQQRQIATNAFSHWETQSKMYWCNADNFQHQHQHIWREIQYAEWLCSEKSNNWLRYIRTIKKTTNDCTELKRLADFYSSVPQQSFCDVYNTRNDESHYNLYWNQDTLSLFQSQHMPRSANRQSFATFTRNFFVHKRTTGKRMLEDETTCSITAEQFGLTEHHEAFVTNVEERHRQHVRHKIRDAYMQIVVHFLRVVCCVQLIVAEHEAEATCAKLCRDGFAQYVFTDDVDALAFGSPNIVFDWPSIRDIGNSLLLMGGTLSPKFSAKIITRPHLLNCFNISEQQFTMWCVLIGTDFFSFASNTPIHRLLEITLNSSSIDQCASLVLESQSRDFATTVAQLTSVLQFFLNNQTQQQSEFLQRQFAPCSVDETLNLCKICANRKMGFAVEEQ